MQCSLFFFSWQYGDCVPRLNSAAQDLAKVYVWQICLPIGHYWSMKEIKMILRENSLQ